MWLRVGMRPADFPTACDLVRRRLLHIRQRSCGTKAAAPAPAAPHSKIAVLMCTVCVIALMTLCVIDNDVTVHGMRFCFKGGAMRTSSNVLAISVACDSANGRRHLSRGDLLRPPCWRITCKRRRCFRQPSAHFEENSNGAEGAGVAL